MIIAPQHQVKDSDYAPHHEWSERTYVQWGSKGVVLGTNSYLTAFFEAFPPHEEGAGGFIRGEGKTIADAEEDAYTRYRRQSACQHLWGRESYTNSGQLCRHCRAFRSGHIKPIVQLGEWRKPLSWSEGKMLEWELELPDAHGEDEEHSTYMRTLALRASLFGIDERPEVLAPNHG